MGGYRVQESLRHPRIPFKKEPPTWRRHHPSGLVSDEPPHVVLKEVSRVKIVDPEVLVEQRSKIHGKAGRLVQRQRIGVVEAHPPDAAHFRILNYGHVVLDEAVSDPIGDLRLCSGSPIPHF
jgi:hypothetical protein